MDYVLGLIKKYQVEYIFVSSLEKKTYPENGLKKFADSPNIFPVVFSSGDTVVYRTPIIPMHVE